MNSYSDNDKRTLIKFGEKLKEHRLAQKYSQEKLAEISGLPRTYISSAERGERNVSLLNLLKISRALSIKSSMLISEE